MELRQLQCMIACAETQSFSKAAETLFTTQSNVSKTISALEKELDQKLFERKQRGIALTPKGRQIYKYALSMVEYSEKIMECAEEAENSELHVSFQPSRWFASAFCEYYKQNEKYGNHYFMNSADVEEILRRISNNLDQLGFAYIEEAQMEKLQDTFQAGHIGYVVLNKTKTVLNYGGKAQLREKIIEYLKQTHTERDKNTEEDANTELIEIPLIQGFEDYYSGLSEWKEKAASLKTKVMIKTNCDYIRKEILEGTDLSTIGPKYPSYEEKEGTSKQNMLSLAGEECSILYLCLFRNDKVLEELPKHFLNFIKDYLEM